MKENYPKCPRCGATVTSDAPDGLCPRCLLALNVATETDFPSEGGEAADEGGAAKRQLPPPPSLESLAPHFPQLEIVEILGRGGMGVVYKARQPKLDRFVALKILLSRREDGSPDTSFAERFGREARALARLNHPNIVAVYDYGEVGGYPFLLMEYVEGVTLRQLLQRGPCAPEAALAIVPKICEALQFAHGKGIVHRDIKPENILLDTAGQVKITDFGIAKIIAPGAQDHSLTGAKDVMGTPHYMAPEQIEQPAKVDHRADIFSLGVVFYEMLTGELPLGKFAPPSRKVQVDVRLDEVVLRTLEKEPERRYQQASQVKSDVETLVETRSGATTVAPLETSSSRPPAGKSPFVRIVEILFDSTFTSPLALKLVNASTLGFLAFLAFLGYVPLPGWQVCFGFAGFSGFFGLIGVAFLVESAKRRKPTVTDRLAGRPQPVPHPSDGKRARITKRLIAAGAGLLGVSFGFLFWVQQPQRLGTMVASDSSDGGYTALASTWRAMRVFGSDRLTYRFTVQGRGGAFFERWEVPVPLAELTDDSVAQPVERYSFASHGRIEWSDDGQRASFQVRGMEVSAMNTVDRSHSFQPGFQPVREFTLVGGPPLENCFLDLETGRILSAPRELIKSLRSTGQLYSGSPSARLIQDWMRAHGLDVVKRVSEQGVMLVDGAALILAEKNPSRNRGFDTATVEQVINAARELERALASRMEHAEPPTFWIDPRAIYALKTREGSLGLVEILESDPRSGRTRLRCKLLADKLVGRRN